MLESLTTTATTESMANVIPKYLMFTLGRVRDTRQCFNESDGTTVSESYILTQASFASAAGGVTGYACNEHIILTPTITNYYIRT